MAVFKGFPGLKFQKVKFKYFKHFKHLVGTLLIADEHDHFTPLEEMSSNRYYLYSTFNNANCVKAALHQLDIKLGGFTSALHYLDGEIVCRNSVILLWPDKISSLNLGCSRVRLCKGLIWFLWSCSNGRLGDRGCFSISLLASSLLCPPSYCHESWP